MSDLCLSSTNLSTRAINILARNGILQLSELEECSLDRLTAIKGMGKKTLDEIIAFKQNPTGGDEDNAYSENWDNFFFNIKLTPEELKELSNHRITEIDMPMRAFHYLTVVGCDTIEQLVELKRDDLDKIPNIGDKTLSIVKEATEHWLQSNGYCDDTISTEKSSENQNAKTNTVFGQLLTDDLRNALSYHDVSEINLPCRAQNVLNRSGIKTIDKLAALTVYELSQKRGLGNGTINEIISDTREWLTNNGYYQVNDFTISDEEERFFTEVYTALQPFFTVEFRHFIEMCRGELSYNEIQEIYHDELTEAAFSILLRIRFVQDSIIVWFKRTSADVDEGSESIPKERFLEILNSIIDEQYAPIVLSCLEKSNIFVELHDTILLQRMTLAEYIKQLECSDDTRDKVLVDRLHGLTLQEIGEKYGLTRERIRQITVKQIKKMPVLFEDYYADVFERYLLGKEDFQLLFPEAIPETHQYLLLRYKKGSAIPQYETGEDFRGNFFSRVRHVLPKFHWREQATAVTRTKAISYILSHECLEPIDFEQFKKKYNEYIKNLGLDMGKYDLNWRSLSNRLRIQENLVFETDGKFRYLPYNFNYLKKLIDFRKYQNSVISCELIYRDYAEELESLDIQNGYELFCCLKNGDEHEENRLLKLSAQYPFDICFRRIPVIIVGEASDENQVVNLVKELSPIGYMDFWGAYEERFGIKRDSAIANLGGYATQYLINGTYIAKAPKLNQYDSITIGSKLKRKDFWFIEELEELWKNFGRRSSIDSLNAATLKSLGYLMFSAGYAYSNQYNSMRDYLYDVQIKDGEVFKLNELDQRLLRLSAFQSCLQKEEAGLRLFEIAPKEYVKDCYLYEQCGIVRADVIEFQQQVRLLCIEKYFNAHSIWNEIREWPFVKARGYNEWLCNSIIHQIQGFTAVYFVGNYILSSTNDTLSIPLICKWIVDNSEKMTLLNLTDKFNDIFGTQITKWKIADKLRSSGLWNQLITDEIDSYIDSLTDNSNFDVDSLLDEEFF